MSGPYLLAIDAGTGSCRALLFTEDGEQVAVSLREWTHHEPPGVPGGQDFDVETNWRADHGLHPRRAARPRAPPAADVAAVAATSMREGIVLYDRGGARDLGLPERGQPRRRREAAELVREGSAETIYREAGDWVSITSPARLRWLARHRPDLLGGRGRPGHAQRLDRLPAGRGAGDRAVLRIQLGDVQPGRADLVGADRADLRHRPGRAARGRGPGHRGRPGHRARPPSRPACGRAPRWWPAGPTPSSGCSGSARRPASSPCWPGRSGRTRCWSTAPLIDPQTRLRTLCHVTPGEWMLEGIGFYCGMAMRWFRDAFCDAEVAAARERGVDPYVVMEEAAAQIPPGSGGVVRDLVEPDERPPLGARQPGVRRLRPGRPGRDRAGGVRARDRGGGRLRGPRAPGHHQRAHRRPGRRADVQRRRGQGHGSGRRSSPTCSACRCACRR